MTRLDEEQQWEIVAELPSSEPQIAESDVCHAVYNLDNDYPDNKVPLLIPEGANKAAFLEIGELVQEIHAATGTIEDVNLYDFYIDVWQVYVKAYGNGE